MNPPSPVLIELDQDVAVVTLNRPERRNALDTAAWEALDHGLRWLGDDPRCRAVVLTGAGTAFCAGVDLDDRLRIDGTGVVEDAHRRVAAYLRVIEHLLDLPQPVIAAVNGPAVGAGFALACACDLRIVGPGASLRAPFTSVGLSGGDLGLTWFLPRLIGPQLAARLLLTGGFLSPAEAVEAGLASMADDEPVVDARRLAASITAQPAYGVRTTKSLLAASLAAGGQREHLRAELRGQLLCALTDAYQATTAPAPDRDLEHAGPHERGGLT